MLKRRYPFFRNRRNNHIPLTLLDAALYARFGFDDFKKSTRTRIAQFRTQWVQYVDYADQHGALGNGQESNKLRWCVPAGLVRHHLPQTHCMLPICPFCYVRRFTVEIYERFQLYRGDQTLPLRLLQAHTPIADAGDRETAITIDIAIDAVRNSRVRHAKGRTEAVVYTPVFTDAWYVRATVLQACTLEQADVVVETDRQLARRVGQAFPYPREWWSMSGKRYGKMWFHPMGPFTEPRLRTGRWMACRGGLVGKKTEILKRRKLNEGRDAQPSGAAGEAAEDLS